MRIVEPAWVSAVRWRRWAWGLALLCWASPLLVRPADCASGQGEHPRLVSAAATDCSTCHADLLEERTTVHAPVRDGCTGCHEVHIGEDGTRITLMEGEPALCLLCHDDLEKAAAGELSAPHSPVTESCVLCHEVHAGDQPALLAATKVEVCGACHSQNDLNASHGDQIGEGTDCSRCHASHGSDHPGMLRASHVHAPFADGSCTACHRPARDGRIRLLSRGEKLCTSCHGEIPAKEVARGSVHAALKGERGRAGCLNCHDPHMSGQSGLVVAPDVALCAECHSDVVELAVAPSGHAPAAEGCLNCHLPHDAENEHLLGEPASLLCWNCHDPTDADLAASHLGADPQTLECVSCHTPHGAGQPHLLKAYVHAPVLDGCDSCHDGDAGRLFEDGESALCLMCHDAIGEAAASAEVPHAALEVARCSDCHNPHAAAQESLVSRPAGGECLACHDELGAGPDETAHGVIERFGCRACHEPHGGSRPKMLRASGADLCLSCHEPLRVGLEEAEDTVRLLGRFEIASEEARRFASLRLTPDGMGGHPVPNHRVVGRPTAEELEDAKVAFEGEMTCLSCHDPHKGKSRSLLLWNAVTSTQACAHCHVK